MQVFECHCEGGRAHGGRGMRVGRAGIDVLAKLAEQEGEDRERKTADESAVGDCGEERGTRTRRSSVEPAVRTVSERKGEAVRGSPCVDTG